MKGRWCASKTTKDQVMKREVLATYTKGTFVVNSHYESNHVLAIRRENMEIGVAYFDISTHSCFVGQFEDTESFTNLRTLLSQIRPVEIVYEKNSLPPDLAKMLKNVPT